MSYGDGIWTPGTGIPSLLFRFCAHATLGIYSNHAGTAWGYIEGHSIPQPPYNPNVIRSAEIAEKWSRIGFYWNFALWIPTALFPNIFVFAAGVFDLFLAVQFAIATALQDPWLPQKKSQCAAVADTWQVPDNSTASIFTLIGSFNETSIPATNVCVTFMNSWNHGIASLVLYALTAVFNVVGAILVFTLANSGERRRYNYNNRRDKTWPQLLLGAVSFIPHLVFKLILIGFDLIVGILPYKIANYIRLPVRYILKAIQALVFPIWRRRRIIYSVPKRIRRKVSKYKQGKDIDMTTIQKGRFLQILHFDTLSLISQHLHYTDMINLSMTSKAVREITFPALDLSNRRKLYTKYTCEEITKTNCFVCRRQICQACTTFRNFGTRLTHTLHGERCEARCTKCFMETFVRRMVIENCACPTSFNQMSESGNPKSICDLCALVSVRDNIKRCGKWEVLHLTADNKKVTQCHYCNTVIPWWSPKWWCCRCCQKDCWGSIHPPW